ncbi:MAG: FkbM family methyltransferase [Chthoniobacterales bacterium]
MTRPAPETPRLPWRYALKMLARSRSLGFTRDAARRSPAAKLAKFRWGGRDVFYRPGTSDPFVLYQVLLRTGEKAEYYVPPALAPAVIVDIGSNIGGAILYFRTVFPQARIFGFEPHPQSFAVLQRNVAGMQGVTVLGCGLGDSDRRMAVAASPNYSGFSTQSSSAEHASLTRLTECEVRHAGDCLAELGIKQIDLLKIDCEGSEAEIFKALPLELLQQTRWIVGEMHDAAGFEILSALAPHFDLDLKKRMFGSSFRFHACNLTEAATLRGSFDRRSLQI